MLCSRDGSMLHNMFPCFVSLEIFDRFYPLDHFISIFSIIIFQKFINIYSILLHFPFALVPQLASLLYERSLHFFLESAPQPCLFTSTPLTYLSITVSPHIQSRNCMLWAWSVYSLSIVCWGFPRGSRSLP